MFGHGVCAKVIRVCMKQPRDVRTAEYPWIKLHREPNTDTSRATTMCWAIKDRFSAPQIGY